MGGGGREKKKRRQRKDAGREGQREAEVSGWISHNILTLSDL